MFVKLIQDFLAPGAKGLSRKKKIASVRGRPLLVHQRKMVWAKEALQEEEK